MSERSTLVIVNPTAGGGRAGRDAEDLLRDRPGLDIRRTVGPGHAVELVRAARARGVRRFLAVGGDGTLHEVVNGALAAGDDRPVVGLLPLGTGNSFGRDVGVTDIPSALAALSGDRTRPVDALRITHTMGVLWSINLVGLGFTALAGDLTNRRFKRLGAFGYVAAVVVEVARLGAPIVRYAVDGRSVDEPLVMLTLMNSRYTGGTMMMAPDASPDDGQLDVIRVGPMSRLRLLTAFPRIFAGTHVAMPEVTAERARRVDVRVDGPVPVMVDGEVVPLVLSSVEVVPAALEVMCPT